MPIAWHSGSSRGLTRSVPWVLAALLIATMPSPGRAQMVAPATGTGPGPPTVETVQAKIASLEPAEQTGSLDDEGKNLLRLYREALAALLESRQAADQKARLAGEQAQVPAELEAVKAELAKPPVEMKPEVPANAGLPQLQQALEQVQADLKAARDRLKELEAEPQRRDTRRAEIGEQIANAQQRLEEINQQLAGLPLAEDSAALTEARRARMLTDRELLTVRIDLLDQERKNYDARRELLPLRRERWSRRVDQLQNLVTAWQEIVEARRAQDIERQQREATRSAALAHPLVAPIAESNVQLARQRDELRPASEQAQQRLNEFTPNPDDLQRDLDRLREKVEVVGMTSTVGLMLRQARTALPDPRSHRRAIQRRQAKMASVEFDRLALEDEYDTLVATRERMVADLMAQLDPALPEHGRAAIEKEIRDQLQSRSEYLNALNEDLKTYFNRLQALNEKEQRVVTLTEEIAAFTEERILWIRSAQPLNGADAQHTLEAVAWLLSPSEGVQLVRAVWNAARTRWWAILLTVATLGVLVAIRRRLRLEIRRIGAEVGQSSLNTFGRTVAVTVLTVVRAATWPAVMWAGGALLITAEMNSELPAAVGQTLQAGASLLFMLLLVWETCQKAGLAEAHFQWRPRALKTARRHLFWFITVLLMAALVTGTMFRQSNTVYENSLGRLALIAVMIAMAVFSYRVFRPTGGVLEDYLRRRRGGWVDRLRYVWYPLTWLIPMALAVAAIIGFQYTAIMLTRQLAQSAGLVVCVAIANGLLLRWLFVTQVRLAREELRKRRAAYEEKLARGEAAAGDAPPSAEQERIDISVVSTQARQLVRGLTMFALLIGLWAIWADVLPAIRFLDRIELWRAPGEVVEAAAAGAAPVVPMITVKDVLLAFVVLVMTVIVGKNIPGLLEISILQRLPLERGSQYAISTITRYAITIVGVVLALGFVGMTWSKVQWLAAAITVGLGFGLQEIFGNFVSGLIILFERPIRVGDTVTVGDVNGTISRIRMRATTLVDWDRKELIIPNKEFVTGKIVNWTLSDPILRIVIPVGIAYGSDTALAENLLLQAAKDHPIVLDDPAPSVVFSRFGDSSLEFNLRLFIPSIDNMFRVRHEIHRAIDRAFRESGIVIAFPQRDIHVRSISGDVSIPVREPQELEEQL